MKSLKKYSLPEVVGKTGIYVPYGDARATAEGIKIALSMDKEARLLANQRIIHNFSLTRRKEKIYRILDSFKKKSA